MRLTHQRQRVSFSTNIFIGEKQWDRVKQRMRGNLEEAKLIILFSNL